MTSSSEWRADRDMKTGEQRKVEDRSPLKAVWEMVARLRARAHPRQKMTQGAPL